MITYVHGTLVEKTLTRAVVDVHGMGYELFIPMSSFDKLPLEGETVHLRTVLHVREDLMQLYGFISREEKLLFELLVGSVSGIGPKLALNVLSCMPVGTFCAAVRDGDVRRLTRINGVGKRSAERLIMELKDKVSEIAPAAALVSAGGGDAESGKAIEDAVAALVTLGFKGESARKAVVALSREGDGNQSDAQSLIRRALTQLNR